jgi:xanthine dehydrogenase iron-sulfur cluster and FAD-binding subunit A
MNPGKTKSNITLMLILLAALSNFWINSNAESYNYTCTGTADQDGINAAISNASQGETINIGPGNCVFTGPVTLARGIKIIGAGPTATIITGSSTPYFLSSQVR